MNVVRKFLSLMVVGWAIGAGLGITMMASAGSCTIDTRHGGPGGHTWNDVMLDGDENRDDWDSGDGQDVLESLPCNDDYGVEGNGANDDIHLGSGNDAGHGGAGRDNVWGGEGTDGLWGGNGDDFLLDNENGDSDQAYGNADQDNIDIQDGIRTTARMVDQLATTALTTPTRAMRSPAARVRCLLLARGQLLRSSLYHLGSPTRRGASAPV